MAFAGTMVGVTATGSVTVRVSHRMSRVRRERVLVKKRVWVA
jgi:hypothetical protein